jgi:outer membrane protein TolC
MIRSALNLAAWRTLSAALLTLTVAAGPVVPQNVTGGGAEPGLALSDVYRLAGERNPRLAASRSLAAAIAARQPGASVLPDPSLQIGFMNLALPSLNADMPSSMAPSVQLMQMVPFPGKLGFSGRIAAKSAEMAQAGAAETWWEVRSEAAMAFYQLYQADRQIAVMRETLLLLEDFGQIANAMYSAGEGRQSDVLRANVEVARMDAEIRRMEAMRRAAAARLNGVLNRPADTPVPTPELGTLPLDLPASDTLLAWAYETRPMLARSRLAVEQSGEQRELARKEIWPDLVFGVQYGQRQGDMGTQRMGSAMVGFSLPIFASKRQLRMRDEAAAMEQMARAELTAMQASVDVRIDELLADIERDRTLVHLYRTDVLPQADANVESAFSSYRVGAVDFMTLVDARMTVNQYEQELYALLADYGRTLADLEMTVGRELPRTALTLTEDR